MRRLRLTPPRVAAAIAVAAATSIGVGYAASLGLSSNQLHAWGQNLTKGTCNQTSTTADDTFVQQASPNSTAGGTATTLTIKPTAGSQDYAFIRFDLSGCSLPTTAGADSAVLSVRVTTSGADTISVFPVTSSWSSSTLTWNGVSGLTDRKSTRLNSSHVAISYAVFCLKQKNTTLFILVLKKKKKKQNITTII